MLLRWLNPYYDELRNDFAYRHPNSCYLPVLGQEWAAAADCPRIFARCSGSCFPKSIAAGIMASTAARDDALVISAAIVLS